MGKTRRELEEALDVLEGLFDTASDEYTDSWPWFEVTADLLIRHGRRERFE